MKKFFRRLSALFFGVFAAPIVLIVCFFLIPDLRVISDEMGPHAFVLFLGLVFGSYLGGFLNKSPKLALLAMLWGSIVSVIAIVMIIKFPGEGWAALGHMLAFILVITSSAGLFLFGLFSKLSEYKMHVEMKYKRVDEVTSL